MESLVHRTKTVLIEPVKFFSELNYVKDLNLARVFIAFWLVASSILGFVLNLVFFETSSKGGFWTKIFVLNLPIPGSRATKTAIVGVGAVVVLYLLVVVGSWLFWLWLRLVRVPASRRQCFMLFAFSLAPSLIFGWIPLMMWVAMVYDVFLLIVGLRITFKLSWRKSLLIVLLPFILLAGAFFSLASMVKSVFTV